MLVYSMELKHETHSLIQKVHGLKKKVEKIYFGIINPPVIKETSAIKFIIKVDQSSLT